MAQDAGTPVTRILRCAAEGQPQAADDLLPLVYSQLRAIAQQRMAQERRDHTLDATALVHEAYLRLVGDDEVKWTGRAHFFFAAAEAMRRILIEHARKRAALKRGGDQRRILDWNAIEDGADLAGAWNSEEILALDDAVVRLEKEDAKAAAVVRLRFFAGLSVDDTAQALGIGPRSVDREWQFARVWLLKLLRAESGSRFSP